MAHKGFKTTWYNFFLGVRMQHGWWLYSVIDDIMRENPQIEKVVEIGTGGGALSVVLALHAVQRDTQLLTFDIQTRGHKSKVDKVFEKLGVQFVEEDVFDNVERIQKHIGDRPTFLFCDGGNKYEEFKTFAPLLPSGSIIAAHDYGDELLPKQMASITDGYEPVFEDLWLDKKYELYTCFYKKV